MKKYYFVFEFIYYNDFVRYITSREFNENATVDDAESYAINWLQKYSSKYGECYSIEIYEGDANTLVYENTEVWDIKRKVGY